MSKFRRGMEIIKICRERLKQAENEFREINEEFSTTDIQPQEEEEIQQTPNDNIPF